MDLREEVNKLNIAISRIAGIYQKFEQQLGKNSLQMRVLTAMYFDGLQTQKEICELYELPKQTVNNIISAFVKQGFIEVVTSDIDRRAKILKFTESGRKYAEVELKPFVEFDISIAEMMGEEKYKLLVSLTEQQADVTEKQLAFIKTQESKKE